jgi:hypothetical protein
MLNVETFSIEGLLGMAPAACEPPRSRSMDGGDDGKLIMDSSLCAFVVSVSLLFEFVFSVTASLPLSDILCRSDPHEDPCNPDLLSPSCISFSRMPAQHLSPRLLHGGQVVLFEALTPLAVIMLVALPSCNVEYSANAKISTVMAMAKHRREWHPLIISCWGKFCIK